MAEAASLAKRLLEDALPQRWQHVQGVAAVAADVAGTLALDAWPLVAAAWLHDIGYAPDLAETGFHALDGARYLRRLRVDERLVCLVAHHSYAGMEAAGRGLGEVLASEFPREDSPTADALCYADMTTSPTGARVSVAERLEEIRQRYGAGHVVMQSMARAESDIVAAVRRTDGLLRASGAVV